MDKGTRATLFLLIGFTYIAGYSGFVIAQDARVAYDAWQENKVMIAGKYINDKAKTNN